MNDELFNKRSKELNRTITRLVGNYDQAKAACVRLLYAMAEADNEIDKHNASTGEDHPTTFELVVDAIQQISVAEPTTIEAVSLKQVYKFALLGLIDAMQSLGEDIKTNYKGQE